MTEDLKFLIEDEVQLGTKIKVVGVGGGGSNAVARMLQEGLGGVEFYVLNTDKQALGASPVANKVAIGKKLTNGLGAGADPSIGRQAALEDTEQIIEILEGADMIFVTAGLGGGTGTGAAPVVASLAKELNALTVAVVTKPFAFEGPRRMKQAERGLAELAGSCDTLVSIPNEKLLTLVPKGTSFFESFRLADDVLRQAVQGIADIITTPGLINRDFSDIRTIMLGMGYAMMGTAIASGENAPVDAARKAINSPLMEEGGVLGARGVLINITGSSQLGIHDVNEACNLIRSATQNDDVQINFGVVMDERMSDKVKVTVIATGFQRESLPEIDRRSPHFPFTSPLAPDAVSTSGAESQAESGAQNGPPEPAIEEAPPMPDYELPAILRKQKRMVQ
ncbi:MAG: cell division protein FtsZ [Acidobacteriaceae bacterium]|nr:cell division protein FtsZ [Acidobacteriaceae bacterium]MBV9779551.1 cell division protein FtsZ [Acidobacteriaceae bacterium]